MLLSTKIKNNTLIISYYLNNHYKEIQKPIPYGSYFDGSFDFVCINLINQLCTTTEIDEIYAPCETIPTSYCYIGLDCSKNNHFEDFSNVHTKINVIAITWSDVTLIFTTLKADSKDIKAIKSKYNNTVYFNFCNDEYELLTNFINSFGKAIVSVCYWSSRKQYKHIKERLDSYLIKYPESILSLNYDTVLSYFEVVNGIKYAGFNINQVAKFTGLKPLPSHRFDTSLDFTNSFVDYMSYVCEYCALFTNIDSELGLVDGLRSIAEMANVPIDIVFSNVKVGNYMMAQEYNKRGLSYVKNKKSKTDSYKGGFNIPPTHKFVKNTLVMDFKAAYINIQMAFKISPENIVVDAEKCDRKDVVVCANGSMFYNVENTVAEAIQNKFYIHR